MFTKGSESITLEQAQEYAKFANMEVSEWANVYGWTQDEGKPSEPLVTAPLVGPVPQQPAGESRSGDILLEQPDYDILPDLQALANPGAGKLSLFRQEEEEGEAALESYFKNIEGLNFEQTGLGDNIYIEYTDPATGKKRRSATMSFDTDNKADIERNLNILNTFITTNVPQSELNKIGKTVEQLKKQRQDEIVNLVPQERITEINNTFNAEDLFDTRIEDKIVTAPGMTGGAVVKVEVRPYENELKEAEKALRRKAMQLGITLTDEQIKEQSKTVVRENLIQSTILDEKIARNKQLIKEGRKQADGGWNYEIMPNGVAVATFKDKDRTAQEERFIADVLLKKEQTQEYDAIVEKAIAAKYEHDLVVSTYARLANIAMPGEPVLVEDPNKEDKLKRLDNDLNYLGIYIDKNNQNMVELKDGTIMAEEYVKALNTLSQKYEGIKDLPAQLDKQKDDAAAALEDTELALDASRRNYDLAEKSLNTVAAGFGDLALSAVQLGSYFKKIQDPSAIVDLVKTGEFGTTQDDLNVYFAKKWLDETRDLYQTNVSFEDAFNDPTAFGEFMLQEISSQIPILTTMVLSGGSASFVAGGTAMGGKMIEMKAEEIEGAADYSEAEMLLKSAGYGLAEGLFAEITTTRILKNIKGKWTAAGKNSAVNNGLRQYAKANTGELILEPIAESVGEVLTTGAQNLIDGRDITEGMDHSGFSGYSIGLIMQGVPFMRGAYVSKFSDYNLREEARQKARKLDQLHADLVNAKGEQERQGIVEEIKVLSKEYQEEVERAEGIINNNLRDTHAEKVIRISKMQVDLQNRVIEIQNNNDSQQVKNQKIEAIEKRFQALEAAKQKSLSSNNMQRFQPEFALLEETDNARYNKIIDAAKARIISESGDYDMEPDARKVDRVAYEIYLEEDIKERNANAAKVEGATLIEYNTVEDAITAIEKGELGLTEEQVKQKIQDIKNGDHGFQIEGGEQVVVVENQLKDQLRNIGTHEVGHYVFDKILKNNPRLEKFIATNLMRAARVSLGRKAYNSWKNTIETDANGNLKSYEVIARFLEIVADGQVDFRQSPSKRKLLGLFGTLIQKEFVGEYDFNFKGEEDIVNFVIGLGKKIKDGTLTRAEIEAASENVILKDEASKLEKEGGIKEAENIVDKTDVRRSAAADRARTRLDELQAEDKFDPNSAETYEILQGMVSAQLSKFKNKGLQITDMEEAVADVVARLYTERDVYKFDGRGTLYGFLNGRISFRIKDAFKTDPTWIEDFGAIDTEGLTGKEAQQVAVEAAETTTAEPEAPTYKNLLQRNVLSPEVIENIKSKVKSTVRTMKTRMDKAVSKNVTVKPYVAEIKKVMGKQADIDFKKAMGGLKDGELRRYLLRHKRAILENMTTTWLMTAMPNAVQKKVNGVWTSDWAGKKIDRETTAAAGRTSGAELVRRLPNASTRLSDADYLSNFFDETGALIRGRKESLAKAMAEEITFDIINQELQNPDSPIREAFEQRQEELSAVLLDNYIVETQRDFERGNVKASKKFNITNPEHVKRARSLWKIVREEGFDAVVGDDGILLPGYKEEYEDIEGVGAWLLNANKLGLIVDKKLLAFQQLVQRSNIIPKSVKENTKKGLNRESAKERKDAYAKDISVLTDALGGEVVKAIGSEIFGIHYRVLDGAKLKAETGKPGEYAALAKQIENTSTASKLPDGLNLEDIRIMNSSMGLMGKIFRNILNKALPIQNKLDLLSKYSEEIKNAGIANKLLYKHIMQTARQLYKEGKIRGETLVELMQIQTNLKAGFRGLSSFTYVTITEDAIGKPKGEHLADNGTTSFDILELIFNDNISDAEFDSAIDNLLEYHDQWAENKDTLDAVDFFGKNNPFKDLRILLVGERANSVYTIDGTPAKDLIEKRRDAIERTINFNKGVNFDQLDKAKKEIKELEESRQVKASKSAKAEALNKEFNDILERKTGVESFKTFSKVQAQMRGAKKGRFKFFVAPNVDDFRGLVNYAFAGKGKQGDIDKAWLEEQLMTPYAKGIAAIDGIRQQIKRDFREVVKAFPQQYKMLNTQIANSGFTYDQAVRVYLWKQAGITPPGLSKKDMKLLDDAIKANPELTELANALLVVARRDQWMDPSEHWIAGTVLSDLNGMTEKIGRKKYLAEFIENAEIIFSEDNLNKIEALFGKNHREAIEDALYSMKNGTNRVAGSQNKTVNAWLNWINGSTGAIMFFNRRSSLLQMLSFTNFINWSDNNPIKAAAAFANQKQYWTDWVMIFNSDKLKERRGGLKQDVSSDEIASVANQSKNSPQAILAYLLKIGFTPTQIADSMAIATGGAMFYRNRVNTYLKQGMDQKAAEEQAFVDFAKKSDEAQQSSDPALVSQLQRSVMGRLVFAFQNTPMQYTRLMKKAALDLANGRGDWKENVSKIAYYGAIQNFIFSALQNALFAMLPGFDDDEEDLSDEELAKLNAREEQKIASVLNSMLDTILKGSGVYGAIAATVKNIIREYMEQEEKGFLGDHAYTVLSLFDVSPPIGSKARKVYSAIQTRKFDKDEIEARGWAVTADGRLNLGPNWSILGKVLSASANVPLDRVVDELTSISEAFDARNKAWQRIALGLGWKTWDVGAIDEEGELIKDTAKAKRKKEGIEKAKKTREETKAKNKAAKKEAWEKYVKEQGWSFSEAGRNYGKWEKEYNEKNK